MPTNKDSDNFLSGEILDGGYCLLIGRELTLSVITVEEAGQELGGN